MCVIQRVLIDESGFYETFNHPVPADAGPPLLLKGGESTDILYYNFLLLFKGGVPRRGAVVGFKQLGNYYPLISICIFTPYFSFYDNETED